MGVRFFIWISISIYKGNWKDKNVLIASDKDTSFKYLKGMNEKGKLPFVFEKIGR